MTDRSSDPPLLKDRVALALDMSPKVRHDWRNFFQFRSAQWNIVSIANAGALAVPAYLTTEKFGISQAWPLWAAVFVGFCTAIGVFYGILTKQKKLNPPEPSSDADGNDSRF